MTGLRKGARVGCAGSAKELGIGFQELAAQYEGEFMRDMARLGVAPPDVMTRVTEYIPEVCKAEKL